LDTICSVFFQQKTSRTGIIKKQPIVHGKNWAEETRVGKKSGGHSQPRRECSVKKSLISVEGGLTKKKADIVEPKRTGKKNTEKGWKKAKSAKQLPPKGKRKKHVLQKKGIETVNSSRKDFNATHRREPGTKRGTKTNGSGWRQRGDSWKKLGAGVKRTRRINRVREPRKFKKKNPHQRKTLLLKRGRGSLIKMKKRTPTNNGQLSGKNSLTMEDRKG